MTPEGRLVRYLRQRAKVAGASCRKVMWQGRRGAPDQLVWWPGPFAAFFELKSQNGRLSKLQEHEIALLRKDGWRVYVCWTPEHVDAAISELTHLKGCLE